MFKPDEALDRAAKPVSSLPKPSPAVTPVLGLQERYSAFSRLLDQLPLTDADRADLHRRGFTDDQITAAGFRSIQNGHQLLDAPQHLPGFIGDSYACQSGYLLPIRTIDGLIVGFQTRSANGYRWASIDGNYRLPNDEPPLVFLPGTTDTIYLVEGTGPKPALINQTTGAMVNGASGGRWDGSPQQIAEMIRRYPDATYTLLPDAGSIQNPRITANYRATADLFTRLGVELGFQWWDQLEKGIDPDADETAFWRDGIRLLSSDFFGDAFQQECAEKIQVRRDHQLTRAASATSEGNFLPAGSIPSNQSVILLAAGMGSGKTEQIKQSVAADSTRTLLASHRRNLSRNGAARIATIPYRQEGEIFDPTTGEVITTGVPTGGDSTCIDSWHDKGSLRRTANDLVGSRVVFDELDQVLNHLLRGTTCKQFRAEILGTLHRGLPDAQQFIGASGTLDDISLEWLEGVTQKDVYLHRHSSTAERWSHSFLESETHALGQIVKAVQSGGNVLIATSDAGDDDKFSDIGAHNLLGYLRQHCPDLTADNSEAFSSASIGAGDQDSRQKLFMRDPVAAVADLRVAIYSPVAETGIDINLQGHFQSVFVLSSGFTMTPQAVVQSAARLRDPAAHRYFWVPNSSPRQKGHGITDWQELVAATIHDADCNRARNDVLLPNVLRNNVAPQDCPHLRAWAKLEIRAELDAKHYRFVIQALLKQFGSEQKQASVADSLDVAAAKAVRQFVDQRKSEAAIAVTTAPLPHTPEFETASREQKVAGRRRQKLETFCGKTFDGKVSEAEVLHTEKAFGPLKLRHLLNNPELAIQMDNDARREISGWEPDVARLNAARRVEALVLMGARYPLQTGKVWSSADPEIKRLNSYLGQHSAILRRLFSGKPKAYADPIRALSWLAGLVGMKTAALAQTRINGQKVTPQMVVEANDAVDVDQILRHWTNNPAIVTGKTPQQKPLVSLGSVPNSLIKERTTSDLGTNAPTSGSI